MGHHKSYLSLAVIAVLFIATTAIPSNESNVLWPKPTSYSYESEGENLILNPCQVKYIVEAPATQFVEDIINLYLDQVFKCDKKQTLKVIMNVVVKNTQSTVPTSTAEEAYSLLLRSNYRWELRADYFPGFLRGFETFSQLFETNTDEALFVKGLPVIVEDSPQFKWRGVMIDSSRHFLPIATIKRTIDVMMFAKLNVLHWHITDEDSFPLFVPSRPELSEFGKIGGEYSEKEVQEVINYAAIKGIRVIPEIDTPAHSQSWGRSDKYKEITLNCEGPEGGTPYEGQFDPTLPLTMQVLNDVLSHVNNAFNDQYIHFGGDEVTYECWGQRPHIKEYMDQHNISSYFDLSVDFRERQKTMWRNISKTKKVIYWANEDIDLPIQDDDVIQWWGDSEAIDQIAGRKNEIILSNYELTYLDRGFGGRDADDDSPYQHWRRMYSFQPKIPNVNVIGGEVCMWDEIGNQYTHDQKVFLRMNILGERLWNDNVNIKTELRSIASRLTAQAARLRARGFKISPVTVGLCEEIDMSICFA